MVIIDFLMKDSYYCRILPNMNLVCGKTVIFLKII